MNFEIDGNLGFTKISLEENFRHDSDLHPYIDINSNITIKSGNFFGSGSATFTSIDILNYSYESDQTYIAQTIKQLNPIVQIINEINELH